MDTYTCDCSTAGIAFMYTIGQCIELVIYPLSTPCQQQCINRMCCVGMSC